MLLGAALACTACSFEAPQGAPSGLALGAPCTDDGDCASSLCTGSKSAAGECVECRAGSSCPTGRTCDLAAGRCLPDQPVQPRHLSTVGGERRRNAEGRVHVGRVSVVPVTTVSEATP